MLQIITLPFSLNFAPELFHQLNTKYFGDLPGNFIYFDDILIYGRTKEEHELNLKKVIERANKLSIKFNPKKLQFYLQQVKYLGYVFSNSGIKIDPDRIKAIEAIKEHVNKEELQRFLGIVNYLRSFSPNLSELPAPLQNLLKNNVQFMWLPSFKDLKEIISTAPVLQNFDDNVPIVIV